MTIVATESVSFTSASNRNLLGRRGPAHADAEYRCRGQRRHGSGRGRSLPGRGHGRGRRERYDGTSRHNGQQRGELRANARGMEDRITLPNRHTSALAITNANTTNQQAAPYEDTITTGHDYYATFSNINAGSVTAVQIDSAAYENANTNRKLPTSRLLQSPKIETTATTDGLSYDPVQFICPKSEVGDTWMSWDETSVNETTVGNYQAREHDDEYHLIGPNSCSELMMVTSRLPIRNLVTDPGVVNGFVYGDQEVRRSLIADNASDTNTL
ncbi:hypothetical protein BDW67DRAFT_185174 [Aspergillus spinulosporus]